MEIRDLELLVALSEHHHFARAAKSCGISQPAFSARIHNLEHRLNAPIVLRGNRFLGFTEEGEIVLKWARQILADADAMLQEIHESQGSIQGKLRIGVVPTALPYAAQLLAKLQKTHTQIRNSVLSLPSNQIQKSIDSFQLEAGITYLTNNITKKYLCFPAYEEHYVLLSPQSIAPEGDCTSWQIASTLPLCLLTPDMQNRSILENAFTQAGVKAQPIAETSSFTIALDLVREGVAATIAPESIAQRLMGQIDQGNIRQQRLQSPNISHMIGIIIAKKEPLPALVRALLNVIKRTDNR